MKQHYDAPKRTGNTEKDVDLLFQAFYTLASRLNIDLGNIDFTNIKPDVVKKIQGAPMKTYIAAENENPADRYGGTWERIDELQGSENSFTFYVRTDI